MEENKTIEMGNLQGSKNVLVARISALGDVAMTIPVLYSACHCYPDVRFVFITRPSTISMFVNPPANLLVVGIDLKGEYRGIRGLWHLAQELRQQYQIDAFIDLQDDTQTRVLSAFMRMQGVRITKINKGQKHKNELTRRHNKVMLPLVSSRVRYREALYKAGFPVNYDFAGLYGHNGKGDPELFRHFTGGPKPAGMKWIGIAPFAAFACKIYPISKMKEVIKALLSRGDCRVFIFGGEGQEQELAEKIESQIPGVTSLAGKKHGFEAELAMFSHLDVMLSMDSVNMHLSAIAGTRTVSVWGATHYYCGFRGWHQTDADMVQLPLSCRPCSVIGDKKCYRGDMLCLNAIRPDVIINKINEILDAPNG